MKNDWEGIYRLRTGKKIERSFGHVRKLTPAGEMNKTEARFAKEYLEIRKMGRESLAYYFDAVKFILARNTLIKDEKEKKVVTGYTPDFIEILNIYGKDFKQNKYKYQPIYIYEIKGHWEDDARVKIKVFAAMFPFFKVHAVKWINGNWQFEEIKG